MQTPGPLTPKQQKYRKVLLAKIHLSPLYVSVYQADRPAWEDLLMAHFNRRSSKDLRIAQLIRLHDYLAHNGRGVSLQAPASPAQVNYLRALWRQQARCPAEKNLLGFARRNTGLALIGLHALTRQQVGGLIAAVKNMAIQRVE